MAIRPVQKYPAQVDTSDPTGYPHGKAKNVAVQGDGTGTPWERDLVNDIFGFQQALLDEAGVTHSDVPDKVGASQYLDALHQVIEDDVPGIVRDVEFTPALDTLRTLGLASGQPLGGASPTWEFVFDTTYVWRSLVNGGEIWFPINDIIQQVTLDGATDHGTIAIVNVSVFWTPGASRTGLDRPLLSLISQTVAAGVPTTTLHASERGDASTVAAHTTTATPASPVAMSQLGDYALVINGGVDSATNKDKIHRVRVRATRTTLAL